MLFIEMQKLLYSVDVSCVKSYLPQGSKKVFCQNAVQNFQKKIEIKEQ